MPTFSSLFSLSALLPKPRSRSTPRVTGPFRTEASTSVISASAPARPADLHLHYLTLGTLHRDSGGHADNVVLLLHGTGGGAHSLLNPVFSDVLFGPGQPLDITKYFIILPDDIGHGESRSPPTDCTCISPQYDYDDMVAAQHAMLVDGLKIDHLRLILGTSMGCMQTFVWGETYPRFSDALAPFACLPIEIAGRNRMMRFMAMQSIHNDPTWDNGNYTHEPVGGLRGAADLLIIAGSAPQQMQKDFPMRQQAEDYVNRTVNAIVARTDANDFLYYFNASRDYNPEPKLNTITAPVLWINSADDFINPPDLEIAQKLATRMPHAHFILIPALWRPTATAPTPMQPSGKSISSSCCRSRRRNSSLG